MYVTVYFMPSYISRVMHLSPYIGFLCAALSSLVMLVVSPFAGKLADRLQRRKPLVLFSTGASTCMTYPVFLLITRAHGTVQILCGTALVTGLMCIGGAAGLLLILKDSLQKYARRASPLRMQSQPPCSAAQRNSSSHG